MVDISSWLAVVVVSGLALRAVVLRGALLLLCVSAWGTVVMRRCLLLVVVGLGCNVLLIVRCHPCLVVVLLAA